jgi:hypothetical protein
MTGSVNCDIVSKGRADFCGAKLIGVFDIQRIKETILGGYRKIGIFDSVYINAVNCQLLSACCQLLYYSPLR